MKTIWKYDLIIDDEQSVMIPACAAILNIQIQGGSLCLWAMVEPENKKEQRTFAMYGTGHPITLDLGVTQTYLTTVQDGYFVWHIFERHY